MFTHTGVLPRTLTSYFYDVSICFFCVSKLWSLILLICTTRCTVLYSIFAENRIPKQSSNHTIVRRVRRISTSGHGSESPSIPEPASHLEHLSRSSNLEHSSRTSISCFQSGTLFWNTLPIWNSWSGTRFQIITTKIRQFWRLPILSRFMTSSTTCMTCHCPKEVVVCLGSGLLLP